MFNPLRSHYWWSEHENQWVQFSEVDWSNCSVNVRVQLRRAGFCPASFINYSGVHK